jgi:Holliday junction DNA helicase RuvB
MRARFGVVARLDYYLPEQLSLIVKRSAQLLGVEVLPEAATELARRARGTPRIANRLLRRIRDFAQIDGKKSIDLALAGAALNRLEVDHLGLDDMDKRILATLIEKFSGGPVGVNTVAVAVGEDGETLEEIYEPFLIQQGLLKRTARGRMATELAYRHLGLPPPTPLAAVQRNLF